MALATGGQATGVGKSGQLSVPVALLAAGVALTVYTQLVKLVAMAEEIAQDAGRSSQWPFSLSLGMLCPSSAVQASMLPGVGFPVMVNSTAYQSSTVVPSPSSMAMRSL